MRLIKIEVKDYKIDAFFHLWHMLQYLLKSIDMSALQVSAIQDNVV